MISISEEKEAIEMVNKITRTRTNYSWIPDEDVADVEKFLKRKYPKIKFITEYLYDKSYLKFKTKNIARKVQNILVKEGYFEYL